MNVRFENLISQAQTGKGTEWISEVELLAFNEYLATRGFGVSRMEVKRAEAGTVRRNIGYGILPAPIGDDPEHWLNHFDPKRSANYVRETVQYAKEDGALFDYKVWAEQPWEQRRAWSKLHGFLSGLPGAVIGADAAKSRFVRGPDINPQPEAVR